MKLTITVLRCTVITHVNLDHVISEFNQLEMFQISCIREHITLILKYMHAYFSKLNITRSTVQYNNNKLLYMKTSRRRHNLLQ